MDLSVTSYTSAYTSTSSDTKPAKRTEATDKKETDETGVVYEKSSSKSSSKTSTDYSAIVNQLKAAQEERTQQLIDLVNKTINGQGKAFSLANNDGNLANIFRNLKVDDDTIEQAKKDIAEDGYWGVEQTSDRLVSMAQALAGGDKEKADKLIAAIEKGFKQATKSWGEDLPQLCQDTLTATIDKMEKWRDSQD